MNTIVRMEDSALDKIFALVRMVSADLSVRTEHVQSIVKMEVFAQCQEISANVEKVSTDQGKSDVGTIPMPLTSKSFQNRADGKHILEAENVSPPARFACGLLVVELPSSSSSWREARGGPLD